MNFHTISEFKKKEMAEILFNKLESPEQLKEFIYLFFGIEYANTNADSENNSNPIHAIWHVYNAFKTNNGEKGGAIWLSARDCYKTLSTAILEVILMIHFELTIAHASAIESQSHVCLRYMEGFFRRIEPLMEVAGWENITQNKRTFEFLTQEGNRPFIKIVIANPKGMNSLHANLLVVDELDLADPAALNEGRNIVGFSRGIHGFTLFLSTRKYAFGNMANAIEKSDEMGYDVLKWNLLDVTERCLPDRYKADEPKENRYVRINLPLEQKSEEEYELLPNNEKSKWELVENAHAGCKSCLLLPICRTNLSKLPETSMGGLYKPIKAVIQKFKENPPDIAEAQLLCWKPGSEGLVYPRFNGEVDVGNVISYGRAWELLHGESKENVDELTLLHSMKKLGIEFYAGVDWGFTHDSALIVIAKIPTGDIWVMENYSAPGLEFSDILEIAKSFRDKYGVFKWFCDTAMPSHLKTFNKNGMKSPNFAKDVVGGIEALRSKIQDAAGRRFFKVLHTENNKKVIAAISKHRLQLDGQGNPTPKPDDEPGVADICDALRYIGQNLFPVKGPSKPQHVFTNDPTYTEKDLENPENVNLMKQEISKRLVDTGASKGGVGRKGGFHYDF